MRDRSFHRAGKGLLTGFVGALSFAVPGAVSAQAAHAPAKWFLNGLQEGICIDFLVSPQDAAGQIGAFGTPLPVESLATDHPALAREVRDEPRYQGWVPAQYCWFLYASGVAGGKSFSVDDGRQPVAVGFLAFAARDLSEGATAYVSRFFTNASELSSVADDAGLRVDRFKFSRTPLPEQDGIVGHYRFEARHGRTMIQWDGGTGAPIPPAPRSIDFTGPAAARIHFVRATLTPDSAFTPSGNLRVVGRGELQAMLSASPIRLVTTLIRGGDSEWDLIP